MTILWAQVESNERGLCRCGQRATSKLLYAEEMDQRQDTSSVLVPSSPDTDQSYRTAPVNGTGRLIPIPEDIQLLSPMSSEDALISVPLPHAPTLGREVSGQRCWTWHKVDPAPGAGASSQFFWCASGELTDLLGAPWKAGELWKTRGH